MGTRERDASTNARARDAAAGWQGTIGHTLHESTPWWAAPVTAPSGAPNVVVILLDDLGYSDLGCYGAEVRTPHIDALAANGVRLSNYTTVPMCTPARAALLTGRNPHAVGCGWLTFNLPGYPGYQAGEISGAAPTMAELLRAAGYSTYAVGKWHNTAEHHVSPSADRSAWPLARGFDRFYGFIGGETHYFAPAQLVSDNAFVDTDAYAADYYCSDDFTDTAIRWLTAHDAADPDKPFFLYLPYNAPHAPLHAKPADLARYDGVYDAGWDVLRAARIGRQRAMGLHAVDGPLPGRSPGVPAWATLDETQQRLHARFMALYAAVVDNTDQNVGRLVACLDRLGKLANTIVVVTSDNGANGIGGVDGAVNNLSKRLTQAEDPAWVRTMLDTGALGGPASWPAYPLGWTDVSSAPFRLYKTTTMNGGIRVPMIVHWPDGLPARDAIRHEWMHVTDVLPTLVDAVQSRAPTRRDELSAHPLDGASALGLLRDANAPAIRTTQHYELAGNRGYIDDGWKIVSLQPPGAPMDLDNWMLFELSADPFETHDLARVHPERLARLVAAFDADARANQVYPLDNRGVRRSLTVPPFLEEAVSLPRTFRPGGGTAALSVVAPMVADRDYQLSCTFDFRAGDAGVLCALGDPIAGLALHVRDDTLTFVYNGGHGRAVAAPGLPLKAGTNVVRLDYRALGARRGAGTLWLNGAELASLDLSPTIILGLGVGEGLDVGCDRRLHVVPDYGGKGACAYSGRVDHVRIVPGPHPPDSYANRPERLAQRD